MRDYWRHAVKLADGSTPYGTSCDFVTVLWRLVEVFLQIKGEKKIKEMWDAWFPPSLQKLAPEYRFDPVMLEKIANS